MPLPFDQCDEQGDGQQNQGTHPGAERESFFCDLQTGWHYRLCAQHQWPHAVTDDGGAGEVLHQIVGQKLSFLTRRLSVCSHSEQDVVAVACPGRILVPVVYHAAEGGAAVGSTGELHLAVKVGKEHVAGTGGAIVVEIIVTVNGIAAVGFQCLEDAYFLFMGQVEHLFGDAAAILFIFFSTFVLGNIT